MILTLCTSTDNGGEALCLIIYYYTVGRWVTTNKVRGYSEPSIILFFDIEMEDGRRSYLL